MRCAACKCGMVDRFVPLGKRVLWWREDVVAVGEAGQGVRVANAQR